MKTTRLMKALTSVLVFLSMFSADAEKITSEQAATAARNWIRGGHSLDRRIGAQIDSVRTVSLPDGAAFHVAKIKDGGFIVMGADTSTEPVVAFASAGALVEDERNPLWVLLRGDFAARERARNAKAKRLLAKGKTGERSPESRWAELLAAEGKLLSKSAGRSAIADMRVDALVKSAWAQQDYRNYGYTSDDDICYNYYTPNHWPCGCVATAGAQVMRCHAYPTASVVAGTYACKVGSSAHDLTMLGGAYSWDAMTLVPEFGCSATGREAIGRLTYDVGVSVGMFYGSGGSSAAAYMLEKRFVDRFQYANAVSVIFQDGFYNGGGYPYSLDRFKAAVVPNFDAGLPVVMGISGSGGHAVVGDGYGYSDGVFYLHVNLGWANLSDGDAWYAPPDIDDYDTIDSIVYNVWPTGASGASIVSGRILSAEGLPVEGASVKALSGGAQAAVATSGAKGIYTLKVQPGDCLIVAEKEGKSASNQVTVAACVSPNVDESGSYWSDVRPQIGNVCGNDLTLSVAGTPEPEPPTPTNLTWYTTKATAFAAAEAAGKRILLVYGRDTCGNTTATRNYTCENAEVKAKLLADYILWYSNCDTQSMESGFYLVNFDGYLPGVTVIDPELDQGIVGTSGYLDVEGMLALLDEAEEWEPPENDNFADATELTGTSGSVLGTNEGATNEDGDPLLRNFESALTTVWWKWTASAAGSVTIDTIGSTLDTIMGVYTGSALSSLATIAEDDDGGDNYTSKCTFDCTAGTTYYVCVSGYSDSTGDISLQWALTASEEQPTTYLVKFDANGGEGSMTDQTFVCGESQELARCAFARSGYVFAGWSTASGVATAQYADGALVCDLTEMPGGVVTLYAVWTEEGEDPADPLPDGTNYTMATNGYTWTYSIVDGKAVIGVVDEGGHPKWWQRAIEPKPVGAVEIPSVLGGCPVTEIGDCALYACQQMTSLTIPSSVVRISEFAISYMGSLTAIDLPVGLMEIADNAFFNCYGLTSVAIPSGVTNVGSSAFAYCYGLKSVTIPGSVQTLGDGVFSACCVLDTFAVDETNPCCKAVDNCLLSKDGKTLLRGPAFENVIVPSCVETVSDEAFSDCKNLQSVTFQEGIQTVGSYVFAWCDDLQTVIFPSTVTYMDEGIFRGCSQLSTIRVAEGNVDYKCENGFLLTIDGSVLLRVEAKPSVVVPQGVTRLGADCFSELSCLTSVTLPVGLTEIGPNAFFRTGVESLVVPATVAAIGESAFDEASSLSAVYFQGNAPECGEYIYGSVPDVVSYVLAGSTGWNGTPDSTELPELWPVGDEYARPITFWNTSVTYTVIFDLGEHGTRTGGGELSQSVAAGSVAILPEVTAEDGWEFVGWDADGVSVTESTVVTGNMAVRAIYECALEPAESVTVTGVATAGTYSAEITMNGRYQLTSAGLPDWVESVELNVGGSHYTLDSSVRYLIVMPISGTGTIALTMKQNFGETRSANWTISGDGDTPDIEVVIVQGGDDDPGDWGLTVETNGYTWTYSVVDGGAVIGVTDRYGVGKRQRAIEPEPTGALVIPSVLGGYPVTGIGSCAFLGCGQMASVTIPAGVTQIGSEAFRSCERLETVVCEGDEATIVLGSGAFYGTPYNVNRPFRLLTDGTTVTGFDGVPPRELVIPQGVTEIGTNAFGLEDNTFQFDSVVIADSVVAIGGGTFAGCEIKNLKLGKGITNISGLKGWFVLSPTGAKFPNGGDSFDTATRLAGEAGEATGRYYPGVSSAANNVIWLWVAPESGSVEFRTAASAGHVDTTLALYDSARRQLLFNDDGGEDMCSRLSYSVTQGEAYFIGVGRYSGADEFQLSWKYASGDEPTDVELPFEHIDFGDGVGYIPSRLFAGCTTLGTVRFGNALYGIGYSAFDGCSSLSNVNFTASIEDIGSSAFRGTALSVVDLSICKRLTWIGSETFCGCSSLTSVVFPSTLREIGECAFADCPNLSEIVLNEGLQYIGWRAFGSTSDEEEEMVFNAKLTRVNIPSSVYCIDGEIFLGCTNLTEITGGEGVVECGSDPFGWNVPAFSRAEVAADGSPLPFKIHRIGKVVLGFQGICPTCLTAADFGDALMIGESAFDADFGPSVTNLVSLALPDTLENIKTYAFWYASNLADIDFGGNASQMYIGGSAFSGTAIRELKGEFRYVHSQAFAYCPNLVTVEIAADTLGENIFEECFALETLRVDAPTVPGWICNNCPNLVSVALGERVQSIGQNAFENCASLKSVVFDGNAPTTSWGMYSGTPDDLTSFVRKGSVGWTGPKAGGLPEAWPVGDAYARPIAYREDVPALTYAVTFDLGEHGVRVGGGELTQTVVGGEAAVAPVVSAEDGWEFYGWSADVESICRPTTVRALYKRTDALDAGWYSLVTTNGNAVCTWRVSIDGSGATISSFSADILKGKLELEIPSEFGGWPVRAIDGSAFTSNAYQVSSIVLPKGLEWIAAYAFYGCNIRSIVIPETVTYIGDYAFSSNLQSVWYEGDRPETGSYVYSYAYNTCSYVREGKWGWDLSTGRWRDRPIKLWTIYPETGYPVTFDLGEHGTRTGGGELEQLVVEGGDAIEPTVQPDEGLAFAGWSWPFTNVTERMTVKALYRDADGRPVDWYDVGGGCVIDLTEYMEEGDWGEIYRYWDVEGDDLVTPYSSELEAGLELNFPRRGLLTFEYKVESSVPGVYPDWMCGEIYQEDNYLECWFEGASSYEQQGWRTCRFAISEPGRGAAYISAGGYLDGTPFRLHLRNFQWTDAPEYVTITLDPKLGQLPDGQSAELQLRTDGTFGELPVPVREGCEFMYWGYEKNYELYDVSPDTPVPLYDMTLTAEWDVPLELVVNPNGDLDDLSFDGDWWVNAYKESGLEIDPVTGELVITDPAWHEYAYYDGWRLTNSTVEVFSATFKGAGILDFSRLDGRSDGWDEEGNYQSRPFTLLVDGEPVEPFSELNGSWILVKTAGDHRLSICLENEWDDFGYAYLQLGAITLEPAPAEVEVTFDPKGGSPAYTTKTYKTGAAYGELPSVAERPGFEFLGWFTAAQGGSEVVPTNLVDFTVAKLYAQWHTDLNTALDNKDLKFVSGGTTGWTGQSGVSHDGVAAAASGFLDYNETNALSTTVTGKGVLSFWWKTDDGDGLAKMGLALTVDGRTTWLGKPYKAGDGWLNFALELTNDGPHTVTWSAAVDSTDYNELTAWGVEMPTLAETIAMNGEIIELLGLPLPGAWVDQVVWTPNETVDIVKWGDSSWQAKRFLPGSAEQMIAKCDARIAADANDYEAHVRRAIARLKKLGEDGDGTFATLLARYGYEFSGELMAIVGELDFTDAPLSNDAVDTVAAKVLPTLGDVLADLETVPQGWTGCVALSPDQYPVDEPVYVDYADVTLAKAAVHGAKAAILAAQGYDLTVDNQKMYEEIVAATNKETLTVAEFTGDWAVCPASRMKGFGAAGFMQLAAKEKKLMVRLTLPTNLPPECATAECVTAEFELANDEFDSLWLSLDLGEGLDWAFVSGILGLNYLDFTEVGVVQTRTEGGYDLEIDLSSLADYKSAVGMELDNASVVWGVLGEEVFYGETYQVVEPVFELVSDGSVDKPELSIEAILAAHPQCAAAIRDQASLDASKAEVRTALGLYGDFDAAIRVRKTDKLHFFEYDEKDAAKWDAMAKAAELALEALDGVVTVKGEDFASLKNFKWTNLNERVSLKPFFDGKILRSLLPPFEGNCPVLSSIPDITFAGTFPDWTMENQMYWLEKIDGVWYDVPPVPPIEPVVTNTITYLGVEGVMNTNVTQFTTNDLPLVLGPVEREGYVFLGWTPQGGVIPLGTATNVTFAALWEANEYTVAFDGNGATSGEMEPMNFTYDAEQALPTNGFAKVGYTFAGWAREAATGMSPPQLADGAVVSNLTAEADGVVTLHATWAPNEYVVLFDANGGEGEMEPQPFVFDGEFQRLRANAFTRTGCTFAGWSRERGGAAQFADGELVANLSVEPGEEVILHAVWSPTVYAISYDLAGGVNSPGNPATYTVFDLPLTLENPTNAYGEFDRWTPNGGVIPVGTASNVAFTAIWKAFHVNGMVIEGRTLTRWEGGGDLDVVVPEFVTEIADGAFKDCTQITSVTLPEGLERIGVEAFRNCSSLMSVELPEGLLEIGDRAFYDCRGLMYVSLPLSLEQVGENVFGACSGITDVMLPTHVARMEDLFPGQFGQIRSVVVPEGEDRVMGGMFKGCASLESVTWPNTVVVIEQYAFAGCTGLAGVIVPDGVKGIGGHAFDGCANLANISLPQALETVQEQAFANCTSLLSVTMPENVKTLGPDLFASSAVVGVNFLGDAPAADENLYRGAATALRTYVMGGTTGWDGVPGSTGMRETWRGRSIGYLQVEAFEVTFDANGGTPATQVVPQRPQETYALPPETPRLDGYAFAGWWTSPNMGGQVTASTKVTVTRPHTLYAHWKLPEDTVVVTFNANGGNVDPTSRKYGSSPTYGSFPVATRRGHRFLGWFTADGERVTEGSAVPSAATTLFAHWTENSYAVVFHSNRAGETEEETARQLMRWNEEAALERNTFTWTDHVFTGWANPDNGAVAYADGAKVRNLTEVYGGNVHLYATWSGATYAIRFEANGGSGDMKDQQFQAGVQSALTENGFAKEGFVFKGWARTEADAKMGNVDFLDGERISDGAAIGGISVLFAVWQPEDESLVDIYLRYNDGGSGSMATVLPVNRALGKLPEPKRLGYEFTGWRVAEEGGEAVDQYTSVQSLVEQHRAKNSNRKSATLVASWRYADKSVEFAKVTFDANGGTMSEADKTLEVMPGDVVAVLPTAVNGDLVLLGWFTAREGGEQVRPNAPVEKDVTFYAHWASTITYLNLQGAANPNPATFTANDLPLVLQPVAREGYTFLGWTPNDGVIPAGTASNVTFTANWAENLNVPIPDPAPSADDERPVETPSVALSYTGYATNDVAEIVGLVTVKVTKKGAVTATVQVPEGTKLAKYTYKGTLGAGGAAELACSKKDGKMTALVCAGLVNGEIAGIGGYTARTSEKTVLAALDGFLKGGVWTVALKSECAADTPALMNGYSVLSVTGGSKGKVKVSGYLADGTKVSLTAQGMAFGDSEVVVPVVYQKKTGAFSFKMHLRKDALAEVGNVSEWTAVVNGQTAKVAWAKAKVSAACNVAAGDRFGLDEKDITAAFGDIVVASTNGTSILPDGVSVKAVNASNGKWTLPKSGKVTLNKDKTDLDVEKFKAKNETEPNPAALKLTYKLKTGLFTGSFALYQDATKDNKPKLKKLTAKVNGAVVNGKGYGTAVVKKVGAMPVVIAPCGE